METFRLATLNVHQFDKPRNYENNLDDLIEILRPLRLDLLAVEETVNDDRWSTLCQRLSLPFFVYGHCGHYAFGNGIASRFPIASHSNRRSDFSFASGGIRSFLQCSFDDDQNSNSFLHNRQFAVTHLDHLDESSRLKQIKYFDPLTNNVDVLIGDFNALTRDDYSNEYFQKQIVDVRKSSNWEKPHSDLTDFITKTLGYRDALKMVQPELKDEQTVTCRFNTRIDYIYLRPREKDLWTLKQCFIHDTRGATDHHAVVATFQFDSSIL